MACIMCPAYGRLFILSSFYSTTILVFAVHCFLLGSRKQPFTRQTICSLTGETDCEQPFENYLRTVVQVPWRSRECGETKHPGKLTWAKGSGRVFLR